VWELAVRAGQSRQVLGLEEVPDPVQKVLLASLQPDFWSLRGGALSQSGTAFWHNQEAGRIEGEVEPVAGRVAAAMRDAQSD